jgi:hypothetical protein
VWGKDTDQPYVPETRPYHAECSLRNVLGGPLCIQGICNGPGSEHHTGMTPRQEALWVWIFNAQLGGKLITIGDWERLWDAFPGSRHLTNLDTILVRAQTAALEGE